MIDKPQPIKMIDANTDLDLDMDHRPSSSMSLYQDEKIDVVGPATPFPRSVQDSPQFILPPTPLSDVKTEIEDTPVDFSIASQLNNNKLPFIPNSNSNSPLNNVPILPHEATIPSQPLNHSQFNNTYPYLYYPQLYNHFYLSPPPQMPHLPPLAPTSLPSHDLYSHPYLRSHIPHPHPSSMITPPARPIPLHYNIHQVQTNLSKS